jgi:exodeoxyribonuclease VII large subunit
MADSFIKSIRAGQTQRLLKLDTTAQHLVMLDPSKVLARGYSLVQDTNGVVVTDAGQLAIGAELRVTFAKGWTQAEVKERGGK